MKYLFVCFIGPVQEFIASARRSRDLWYGSWMLSELSKAAAKRIERDAPNGLIFPSSTNANALDPGSRFTVPNKIVAILDDDGIGAEVQAAVSQRMDELWDDLLNQLKKKGGSIDEAIAKNQINDLIEYYWVSVPFDEDRKNGYSEARNTAERLLTARKATRNFVQAMGSGRPKSSLDGARESVIPEKAHPKRDESPKAKEKKIQDLYLQYHARRGEQLSGVDLLKRLGAASKSPKFLSTSDMAAIPFIKAIEDTKGNGKGKELIDKIKELLPKDTDELDGAEEGLVFESRFSDSFASQELSDNMRGAFTKLLTKYAGNAIPNPYYALLTADGDNMGVIIDAQVEPDKHRALSQALGRFAGEARSIITGKATDNKGVLIYSGGDDVMAYLPLHTVLAGATELEKAFRTNLQGFIAKDENGQEIKPTLSIGIAITHHIDPLSDALELARNAEKEAKREPGKNGFAITLNKRGGSDRTIKGKWGDLNLRLGELINFFEQGDISGGTAYELQELHRVLSKTGIQPDGVAKEAFRIVSRKREANSTTGINSDVKKLFRHWIVEEKISLEELAKEMIIASMFANTSSISDTIKEVAQ